jgi:Na+-transporting NADH:ubiquinone oxidoreductase subunit E
MIIREYTLLQAFGYGLGSGVGWALAIVAMAGIRQRLAQRSRIPKGLEGAGIALIIAGTMALAFMGFNGMVSLS